jgi:tetratricopeptide (TPR) repeat protein
MMLLKKICIGIVILFEFQATAVVQNKRLEVMYVIDQEIKEVERLQRVNKKFDAELEFRKADLYLEKGRLIKESENEDYLNSPAAQRGQVNKKEFFRQSYRYFLKAKEIALVIPKKNKRYEKNPELYYIIGFYAKEFGDENDALKYFKSSESVSSSEKSINLKAKTAIAEIFFNQKKYLDAMKYYEKTVPVVNDKWWTKDAYNLSWCYFKTKNYKQSITLMKKVIEKSADSNYVDLSREGLRDIGLFYGESGQIDDGVSYLEKQKQDVLPELMKIGIYLRGQGNYQRSLSVFNQAIESSPNYDLKTQVCLEKMILADKFNEPKLHMQASQESLGYIRSGSVSPATVQKIILQVQRQVGLLQKKNEGRIFEKESSVILERTAFIEKYFAILNEMDEKKSHEYAFYNAESQFFARKYERAAELYKSAFDQAKVKNDLKIMKLSAEGLLSALGPDSEDFKNRNSYYEVAYSNYLSVDPRSQKSEEVYKRLFKLFYEQKNAEKMKELLQQYASVFSTKSDEQDKMVSALLSVYQKKKQNEQSAKLIDDVNSGKFFVSQKLKGEVYDLSQKIELKQVESFLTSGDYKKAEAGYLKAYNQKSSSKLIKSNASYNLMVIYYKSDNLQATYDWSVKALQEMQLADLTAKLPSFVSITKYLFERMQFTASADLSHRVFAGICQSSQGSYKKTLFNNAVLSYRAAEATKKLKQLIQNGEECRLDNTLTASAYSELRDNFKEKKSYNELYSLLMSHPLLLSSDYEDAFYLYPNLQSLNKSQALKLKNHVESSFKLVSAKMNYSEIPLSALDLMSWFSLEPLIVQVKDWASLKFQFPEKTFNQIMEKKIKQLANLVDQINAAQRSQSRISAVFGGELLAYMHLKLAKDIEQFRPGKSVSSDYERSFLEEMKKIYAPLRQKGFDYVKYTQDLMNKKEILASSLKLYPLSVPLSNSADYKSLMESGEPW